MKSRINLIPVIAALFIIVSFALPQPTLADTYYAVKGVGSDDVLNMRKYPGTKSQKIAKIPPKTTAIKATGKKVYKGATTWVQIHWKAQKGWVNKRFLTPSSHAANTSKNSGTAHTHPKNECTKSVSHSHASNNPTHVHRYSCKQPSTNTAKTDVNSHTHPRNKCTRSISHSHPNGKHDHKHRYSCGRF